MAYLRTHRAVAVFLCGLVTALGGLVIVLVLGQGSANWTGVAVTVPSCPADAQGCRLFIAQADGAPVLHADWSGAAKTLDVQLPAGSYAISSQGCSGYEIANNIVSVASGATSKVNLGTAWEMPRFLDRTCPGFIPTPSG